MKAVKQKSGKYRARVYDYQDANGKQHFKSFTADTKKEAEMFALQYSANKTNNKPSKDLTVGEAIDKYIKQNENIFSPTSISGYKVYRQYGFQSLMPIKISKLNDDILRDAVAEELTRITRRGTKISNKTVRGEFSLIRASIVAATKSFNFDVNLPPVEKNIPKVPTADEVYNAVKGTDIELPVLLAMWLSFSFSEIKGLKHSSIDGDYIQIDQVRVTVNNQLIEKKLAKTDTRTRRHRIPPYIRGLIAQIPTSQEYLVELTHSEIRRRLERYLRENNLQKISFHKLRHINASTMLLLNIPDKYAMERGGWSTDSTMKSVYMHTFTPERVAVDNKIDNYFESIIIGEKQKPTYDEFLAFMKISDTETAKSLYNQLINLE